MIGGPPAGTVEQVRPCRRGGSAAEQAVQIIYPDCSPLDGIHFVTSQPLFYYF
ncbi:hypothetical protein [Priestia megaterium]|uniref:hypothetical protein n=1 Tax=Priestia megaterium TaxID=1404 RepID=UPI002E1DC0CE